MPRPKLEKPNYRLKLRGPSWVINWTQDGKPQSISTGTSCRDEAEKRLAQYIAGTEKDETPTDPAIDAILDGYLKDRHGQVASYATLLNSAKPIRLHIGSLEPHQLSTKTYWERRRKDGVAPGTIIREGVTLRAALTWARKQKWIREEPHIDLPSPSAPRDRWLSREEADRLVAAALTPHLRLFILVALHTAARKGAITDLTWDRVDLERRIIILLCPGREVSKKRRATVPISGTLLAALTEAKQNATCEHVIEFRGRPAGNPKKAFERAVERAGVLPCTPHTLRHTAATWMVIAGVPLAEVARFLGDTEAMVEKVYGKHSPDYLRRAADALDGRKGRVDDDDRPRP